MTKKTSWLFGLLTSLFMHCLVAEETVDTKLPAPPISSASEGQQEQHPLPETQPSSEQLAAIASRAGIIKKQLGDASGIDFEYTKKSVKWLDKFVNRHRKSLDDLFAIAVGSYLGETIRVNYGCKWVLISGGMALHCANDLLLFPLSKAIKQVNNGSADSIYAFYLAVPNLIAVAGNGDSKPERLSR